MKRYTVGFVFDKGLENVLLVGKTHPEWQKGKFNGPGGRIEEGETPVQCMAREMKEEADLSIAEADWKEIAVIEGNDIEVVFFATEYKDEKSDAISMTEEKVGWFKSNELPPNVISNLRWLIPLSKDRLSEQDTMKGIASVKVTYHG